MNEHNCPHPEQCAEEAHYLAMAAPHKKGWWALHESVVNDRPAAPTQMFKGELIIRDWYAEHGSSPILIEGFGYRGQLVGLSLVQRLTKWWKSWK